MEKLIKRLFKINAVKFGQFSLKSKLITPVYIDIRELIGHPDFMNEISEAIYELMAKDIDQICGVPYTALPIACCISVRHNIPLVIKRKEVKDYGTKKLIEGVFENGMTCCIIEDVIVSGTSVIETANELRKAGLNVTEAIILIDRCQGGRENLNNFGISVKSLLTIDDILSVLFASNKITDIQYETCKDFLENNRCIPLDTKEIIKVDWNRNLLKRENKISKKILEIVDTKRTNLCVAAEVETMRELLSLARKIAPFICILKVHSDIIHDFDLSQMIELKKLATEDNFLLMEDRKFAIHENSKLSRNNRCCDYLSWCDLVSVGVTSGDHILTGIRLAAQERNVHIGCLVLPESNSKGTNYPRINRFSEIASDNSDIVVGFVSELTLIENMLGFIHFTNGIKFQKASGDFNDNYHLISNLKKPGLLNIPIMSCGMYSSVQTTYK